jgi:hypothetical protein
MRMIELSKDELSDELWPRRIPVWMGCLQRLQVCLTPNIGDSFVHQADSQTEIAQKREQGLCEHEPIYFKWLSALIYP